MPLKEVLVGELRDLYSAENQILKALPKLVKAAENEELSQLLADHLEETKNQVQRLKDVFGILEMKPTGKHCSGMEGVVEEGKEALEEDEEGPAFDLGICGGSVRVEHYEIAGYTACIAMAEGLGMNDVAGLLEETLAEEQAASEKLTAIAEQLIQQAVSEGESEDPEEKGDKKPKTGKEKYSDKKSKEDEKEAKAATKKPAGKK